jgi:hypothetical protein
MTRSSRRSRRARAKPSATATTTGAASRAPTAEREVDRMLREWRAEADATRDWLTRLATASRRSRALGEETEKADHDGSKRLDKREASPFQSGSPA